MRVVRASSEDEMVAVFLRGELASERSGVAVGAALERTGADRSLVQSPDLADDAANALRRRVLRGARGYGTGDGLFGGYPDDIEWRRTALRPEEVGAIRYIAYSYWVELSGGTRMPRDAARRIRDGVDVFGVPSSGFLEAAAELAPETMPELIVVSAGDSAPLVVLEGHVRLTCLALRPELLPPELEVLLGTSPRIAAWWLY